jgi:hypothetical protein
LNFDLPACHGGDRVELLLPDEFGPEVAEQFRAAVLEQFSIAALDQFTSGVLDLFGGAYFQQLLLASRDATYGARARQQPALKLIRAADSHGVSTGDGVTAVVIDTGMTDHWFLRDRVSLGGFDFVDGDTNLRDERDGEDSDRDGLIDEGWGHGTHVAGIVSLGVPCH